MDKKSKVDTMVDELLRDTDIREKGYDPTSLRSYCEVYLDNPKEINDLVKKHRKKLIKTPESRKRKAEEIGQVDVINPEDESFSPLVNQ